MQGVCQVTACAAHSCDDPRGGPEPTADLDGMPAHPDCAAYEQERRASQDANV